MKKEVKVSSDLQQVNEQIQESKQDPIEFATPEDMLRHDAKQTPVPESVEERLKSSVPAATPGISWWKRLFRT